MNMINQLENNQVMTEKIRTGFKILKLFMPIVLKATISESVLILLNPARTPISVAIGMVKDKKSGRR
jgi:hypothetical protein